MPDQGRSGAEYRFGNERHLCQPVKGGYMNLIERAKNIILQPKPEWQAVAVEPTPMTELYKSYVCILAAIAPIASLIGLSVIGISIPVVGTVRVPFGSGLGHAIVSYLLTLVGVFVLAQIIDALAPTFGGEKNQMQAFKVAAYWGTPGWIAGVVLLYPPLSVIVFLATLYGLYLLYLGLPVLMKVPQERALVYTIAVVVCAIIIFLLISLISGFFGGISHPIAQ
jgi:hypothetical protein